MFIHTVEKFGNENTKKTNFGKRLELQKKSNRRPFTLVELLIGLTLLFTVSGLFFVSIRRLFEEETFKASSYRLLALVRNGSDLAQILHIDTEFEFIPKEEKVDVRFSPIGSLTPGFDRWFASMKIALDGVRSIALQESGGRPENVLIFNDRGFDFSEGVLALHHEDSHSYILLPGYPAPLHLSFDPIDFQEYKQQERLFEEALTTSTFREVQVLEPPMQEKSQEKVQENGQEN